MNLGELKTLVSSWTNDSYEFTCATFTNPHSYRWYYNEVSFELCREPMTVADIKQFVRQADADIFVGWKGGAFTYNDNTPVHLSRQGEADDKEGYEFVSLVLAMSMEYLSFNSEVCYNTPMEQTMETKMTTKAPRKTAAQKRAEAEALRLEQQRLDDEKFVSEYQARLLTLVHAYMYEMPYSHPPKATKEDEKATFTFETSNSLRVTVSLPMNPSDTDRQLYELREDMEEAEQFLETTREKKRLEREREAKKTAARAKLTQEELELLGL